VADSGNEFKEVHFSLPLHFQAEISKGGFLPSTLLTTNAILPKKELLCRKKRTDALSSEKLLIICIRYDQNPYRMLQTPRINAKACARLRAEIKTNGVRIFKAAPEKLRKNGAGRPCLRIA
jgi:hypothetical protein